MPGVDGSLLTVCPDLGGRTIEDDTLPRGAQGDRPQQLLNLAHQSHWSLSL